jgi:hypothetical protein
MSVFEFVVGVSIGGFSQQFFVQINCGIEKLPTWQSSELSR